MLDPHLAEPERTAHLLDHVFPLRTVRPFQQTPHGFFDLSVWNMLDVAGVLVRVASIANGNGRRVGMPQNATLFANPPLRFCERNLLLRHTVVQRLVDDGMPNTLLQKFLEHEHLQSTQV